MRAKLGRMMEHGPGDSKLLADGILAQNFEEDISVNMCIQIRFKEEM